MRQQTLADGGSVKYRKKIRKGKQWYFGMKALIGSGSKAKAPVVATAASVHDKRVLEDLLHGEEPRVRSELCVPGAEAGAT